MVAVVLIHMCQVFLFGAYKFPRQLTWIIGVFLLLMTLGMVFTGQVLRFDQDAYWGLGIGASITSRVPLIGAPAVHMLLGGPIIAGATLSRFFALHVFLIPGLSIGFVGLHLLMVLKLGINEWPRIGGSGGLRGPALDSVAITFTYDQLVRQVIQGGGNMPAYGKNSNPAEVTALVSFLETLRPPGRPPARDASQAAMQQSTTGPASDR
jgi:hypothetical protein